MGGLVRSAAEFGAMVAAVRAEVRAGRAVGFDTEWDAPTITHRGKRRPDPLRADLVGYSLAVRGAPGWYVPRAHGGAVEFLRKLLTFPKARVVAHNCKSELHVLRRVGFEPACELLDSELLAWLAGWRLPGKGGLKLKALAAAKLGYAGPDFEALARGRRASEIPPEELAPYAAQDAVLTLELGRRAWAACRELGLLEPGGQWELDRELIPLMADVEATGVDLDAPRLEAEAAACEAELSALEAEFAALTRTTVAWPTKVREQKKCPSCYSGLPTCACNIPGCMSGQLWRKNGKPWTHTVVKDVPTERGAEVGNDGQVSRWLYDELRWWPKGARLKAYGFGGMLTSVKEEDIRAFAGLPGDAGRAARLRLRYQALRKYASTYTRGLVSQARQSGDGLLHASFKQDGTVSQRFSSSGPNFQNLPGSERQALPWLDGLPDIRASFRAPEGWVCVIRDWSQLELRLIAHFSQDPTLIDAYRRGVDLHAITMEALGCARRPAKVVNFSVAYGITAPTLTRKIGLATDDWSVTPRQAQAWIDGFFERYPRVADMREDLIEAARRDGRARTLTGHSAPIPELRTATSFRAITYAQNQAVNIPIQGTAGGIAKLAMRDLARLWKSRGIYGTAVRFQGQVHDELICVARPEVAESVNADMERVMARVGVDLKLSVPLASSGGIGRSWADAKAA